MNTKSKIKVFFDSKQENAQYIEKYEENVDFFDDLLKNGHKEDIEFVISIKLYNYAGSLKHTGKFKKTLTVLSEIEFDLDKIKGQSKFYNQYVEGTRLLKGVCLRRLKKYTDSNKEFKKLLNKSPENDNFIKWYKANKKSIISKNLYSIAAVGIAFDLSIMLANILDFELENFIVKNIGFFIALLAFVTSYLWNRIVDRQLIQINKTAT